MNAFTGFRSLEANFTPTPNQFFDYVVPNFPGGVVAVVATIIRATLGWTDNVTGEKRIEAELSLPEIVRRSGLSRNAAREGIRKALEASLIVETATAYATSGSRYALRWDDQDRQRLAIERHRKALDDLPPTLPEGVGRGGQKVDPLERGSKSDPVKKWTPNIKERVVINKKNKTSLNVREDGREAQATERSTLNASGTGMFALREKAVEEIIALTGDEGSQRRFEQLWDIAEGRDALDAWKAAQRAIKRRMEATGKEPLERPGAYFDSTCVRELEKRQVFVPTTEEKQGQKDVAEVIRQGLFQEESIAQQAPVPTVIVPPMAPKHAESAETPAQLDEELLQLEREGGALWKALQSFMAAERARYVAEMGSVSSTSRERLLTAFDRPEKRRSLLRAWKASVIRSEGDPKPC